MQKIYKASTAILFAGLFALAVTPANAAETTTNWASGFYATASVGQTRADIEDMPGFSVDDTDTGYSLGLGYEFNKYVAFEAGYVDLGETTMTLGAFNAAVEADGFYFGPKVSLPITDKFSVFGKVGLFAWDVDASSNFGVAASASGTDAYFGAGLAYDITDALALKAEWTRYNSVGDENTTDSADVDFIAAGLVFKFGKLF